MENQPLSHEESLRIIQGMINIARNRTTENGFHFLLWGILVIAASLANYFLIPVYGEEKASMIWLIMTIIGIPLAIIYEKRKDRTSGSTTRTDQIFGNLWMGFGITLFITIFIAIYMQANPVPFILLLVGLATFVTGRIMKFMPLTLGGLVFWISAIAAAIAGGKEMLLINALAIFLGYIIPGILMNKRAKKEGHV